MFKHFFAFAIALGFTAQAGEKMPEQAVVPFSGIGFRFGLCAAPGERKPHSGASNRSSHPNGQRSYRSP